MSDPPEHPQSEKIRQAIAALDGQRAMLGDSVVEASISALKTQLAELEGHPLVAKQQRKLASILFADIVGSTGIGQGLEPDDVLELMDTSLKRLTGPVERHGGHVTRYMGDGFMAVFGVPIAHENDPEQAVRAGLEILEVTHEIARELGASHRLRDFQVRVGVSTGLVATGGEMEAGESVMGMTVNLAKRLESAAPPGGLLISHNTYRHIRGVFEVEPQEPVRAKGFQDPVQAYLVKRAKPRAFRLPVREVEGVETRMIGREAELSRLKDALLTIFEEGEGQVFTILGEAGIGKSRLIYEFLDWVELRPESVLLFLARAREDIHNQANALLRDAFVFRFEIQDNDPPETVCRKVETGFGTVFQMDPAGITKAHVSGQLLGFDFHDSPYLSEIREDPQRLYKSGLAYLEEYFQKLSERAPVLVIVEDIHWGDDSSLDILAQIGRSMAGRPVLLVFVARTSFLEQRPYWGEGQLNHTRLQLKPLSKRESQQLAAEILMHMEQIPVPLRELLVSWSEGNPFYMEELVKMLIEQNVIVKGEKHWGVSAGRFLAADIPPTLAGVIQARLDSLPTFELEVLQEAAVIGRLFWDKAVVYLHPNEDKPKILEALAGLRDRELIYRRETSAFLEMQEFIFKHTLLREVAYESLPKRRRQGLHGKIAGWLIENSGQRENEFTGLIASHLEGAGETVRSADYLIKAGDQARALYAHSEAERYYRQAIRLLQSQERVEAVARTLLKLGLVYTASFDTEKARQSFEQAFELWEPLKDTPGVPAIRRQVEVLRMAAEQPSELDPGEITADVSSFIASQLFEGLVKIGENHSVLPATASRWEVASSGKEYVFHLRPDARWCDGTPVTAGDFEFAWKRNLDPRNNFLLANLLSPLENARLFMAGEIDDPEQIGVKAIDQSTLLVRLEHPSAYLPYLLTHSVTYPLPGRAIERHGPEWTQPGRLVGNGPYQLLQREEGPGFVLARNPYYTGSFPGNVERVEGKYFPGYDQALKAYEEDQVDTVSMWNADPEMIARVLAAHRQELVRIPQLSTFYLSFRVDRPPFDNPSVRKAFIQAINRQALVQEGFGGQRQPAFGGFLPPGMPGHYPEIGLSYDPDGARRDLAQAGYPRGKGFPEIHWLHVSGGESVIRFLQRAWQQNLGLDLHPQGLDWDPFLQRLDQDPPDLWLSGWTADFPDPDCMLRVTFHSEQGVNSIRWGNLQFDSLVEQAVRIIDDRRRIDLYQQADRILVAEEAVVMPLTYGEQRMLVKPWVSLLGALSIQMPLNHLVLVRN